MERRKHSRNIWNSNRMALMRKSARPCCRAWAPASKPATERKKQGHHPKNSLVRFITGGCGRPFLFSFTRFCITKVYGLDAPSPPVPLPIDLNCHALHLVVLPHAAF